ncbi:hypothetical protein C7Y66_19355 [Chroococcidiopsis sp. CCALA 051]|jgi:hypothetical protein|uniref:hypothetical protein n=1 Tax=Chroococcidiopsis sp. CCALA 051 TaxID=869949 RepID=UPI000D0DE224|nr:hypothetical protein [Chroococcidiopsis sp. CCALA 051]PSM47538.1 hypothetical protein C7Y66_19355 [Chroococcidiopsis sp. CCALA 051]
MSWVAPEERQELRRMRRSLLLDNLYIFWVLTSRTTSGLALYVLTFCLAIYWGWGYPWSWMFGFWCGMAPWGGKVRDRHYQEQEERAVRRKTEDRELHAYARAEIKIYRTNLIADIVRILIGILIDGLWGIFGAPKLIYNYAIAFKDNCETILNINRVL